MNAHEIDRRFVDAIAEQYERHLVPLIFEPYATDIAARVAHRRPARVLEIAAGTGVATRQLGNALPAHVSIVATDLNEAMLQHAAAASTPRAIEWRQADAMQLPFGEGEFDVVACQFGVMFFPDKIQAFSETRRVLRSGGALIFSVWDQIAHNEFADVVTHALASMFPDDPPRFLARTPHGYYELAEIAEDLADAGFARGLQFITIAERSRAESPEIPALAYCQGTPLRTEIELRAPDGLAHATRVAADAIAQRFGPVAVDGKIQAHVIAAER